MIGFERYCEFSKKEKPKCVRESQIGGEDARIKMRAYSKECRNEGGCATERAALCKGKSANRVIMNAVGCGFLDLDTQTRP